MIGQIVKIVDFDASSFVVSCIKEYDHNNVSMDVCNQKTSIGTKASEIARKTKSESQYKQGMIQNFEYSFAGNADASYPFVINFHIPNGLDIENASLQIVLQPFRLNTSNYVDASVTQSTSSAGSVTGQTADCSGYSTEASPSLESTMIGWQGEGPSKPPTNPEYITRHTPAGNSDVYWYNRDFVLPDGKTRLESNNYIYATHQHEYKIMRTAGMDTGGSFELYPHVHEFSITTPHSHIVRFSEHKHAFGVHTHVLEVSGHLHSVNIAHSHKLTHGCFLYASEASVNSVCVNNIRTSGNDITDSIKNGNNTISIYITNIAEIQAVISIKAKYV